MKLEILPARLWRAGNSRNSRSGGSRKYGISEIRSFFGGSGQRWEGSGQPPFFLLKQPNSQSFFFFFFRDFFFLAVFFPCTKIPFFVTFQPMQTRDLSQSNLWSFSLCDRNREQKYSAGAFFLNKKKNNKIPEVQKVCEAQKQTDRKKKKEKKKKNRESSLIRGGLECGTFLFNITCLGKIKQT